MVFKGSVYLSKVTGDPVSVAEARTIMSQHGTLESVWHSSKTEKEMYSLPEGIWVKYAFFDDCRDAQVVSVPRLSHELR